MKILKKFKLEDNTKKLNKHDWIIMGIMVLLYGILSFIRLGDIKAPSTYKKFAGEDNSVIVSLKDESYVRKMYYYVADGLGEISISSSVDGKEYTEITTEEIGGVFYWKEVGVDIYAKYIKFYTDTPDVELGEVAIYDASGNMLALESDTLLTDESSVVPKEISFMNSTYFDEIYYARSAYEYANELDAFEWSHPPLGKLIMTVPVALFGFSPFNYRLMGNVFGILMIPLMYILAKRLFKNRKWALLAGLIMMFDCFHFVHTRIALVDGFQVFFIMLSVLFMKEYMDLDKKDKLLKKAKYLLLSGTFIGCAIATKWNASYAAIGLAIVFFVHLFKQNGFKLHRVQGIYKLFGICVVSFIIIPVVIYVLSYLLFPTLSYYDGTLKGIIDTNKMMYEYHSNLVATHPFSSEWYEWPIMLRPVWLYSGDTLSGLRMTISDIGNPAIWWFGIVAFIYLIISSFKEKNKTNIFLVIFILSTFIPYIFIGRLMFMYHYFITLPFVMLGIVSFIKSITEKNKNNIVYYGYIALIIIIFIIFYPIVSATPVSSSYVDSLKWIKDWFF